MGGENERYAKGILPFEKRQRKPHLLKKVDENFCLQPATLPTARPAWLWVATEGVKMHSKATMRQTMHFNALLCHKSTKSSMIVFSKAVARRRIPQSIFFANSAF